MGQVMDSGEFSPAELPDLTQDLEVRRTLLARRMLLHRARTQTVCRLTGLTPDRLATLRYRWGIAAEERQRGPSPNSLAPFFRSAVSRSECAAVLSLWRVYGGTSAKAHVPRSLTTQDLTQGERLCEVFEAFRRIAGDRIEYELLVLLIDSFAKAGTVKLAACSRCQCAVAIDAEGASSMICSVCCYHEDGTVRQALPRPLLRHQVQQCTVQHEPDN